MDRLIRIVAASELSRHVGETQEIGMEDAQELPWTWRVVTIQVDFGFVFPRVSWESLGPVVASVAFSSHGAVLLLVVPREGIATDITSLSLMGYRKAWTFVIVEKRRGTFLREGLAQCCQGLKGIG